jgi:hypothetical protein
MSQKTVKGQGGDDKNDMDEQILITLMNQRKGQITIVQYNINEAKKLTNESDEFMVKVRLEEIEKLYAEFKICQKELNAYSHILSNDELKKMVAETAKLNDDYLLSKGILTSLIKHEEKSAKQDHQFKVNINLPAIQIKPFTGNFDDWEQFRDTFESMIISNKEMTDCQKLLYLKTALKYEPFELIKNFSATNENFAAAWSVLKERYQHTRKIFESNFKAILNLPNLTFESYDGLKKMLDTYTNHMKAIEVRKIPIANTHPFIIYLLTEKFDSYTRKHWAEELKGSKELPTEAQFKNFLQIRISIAEHARQYPQRHFSNNNRHKIENENQNKQVASFQTHMNDRTNERKPKCTFCGNAHRPYECTSFREADLKQKYKLVREKSLCINCLYQHHVDTCKSKYKCNQCNAKHHSMLHGVENIIVMTQHMSAPANQTLFLQAQKSKPNTSQTPELEACSDTENYTCHLVQKTNALLGTALIPVHNKGKIVYLRALIDNCSMGDFISARGAQKLQLKQNKMSPANVTGMKKTVTNVAKAWANFFIGSIHNENYKHNINAFIVDDIADVHPKHMIHTHSSKIGHTSITYH